MKKILTHISTAALVTLSASQVSHAGDNTNEEVNEIIGKIKFQYPGEKEITAELKNNSIDICGRDSLIELSEPVESFTQQHKKQYLTIILDGQNYIMSQENIQKLNDSFNICLDTV